MLAGLRELRFSLSSFDAITMGNSFSGERANVHLKTSQTSFANEIMAHMLLRKMEGCSSYCVVIGMSGTELQQEFTVQILTHILQVRVRKRSKRAQLEQEK